MSNIELKVEGRIWINAGTINFVGDGKIHLLEKIKELGSLRKASLEMKMSYRQAWGQINKMNLVYNKPLVVLHRGGKDGGIAELTAFGEKIITIQKELHREFELFLDFQSKKIQNV
jgi:molybdate transport system regulatory protein